MKGAALAAVLAFSWANRAGCCWLAGHRVHTVRGAPLEQAEAGPPPSLRALVFGDFGDDTCQQAEVARGMAASHARVPFDVAFSVGDNLYECGPDPRLPGASACDFGPDDAAVAAGFTSPPDPRFHKLFEGPLEALGRAGRPFPVFVALGNHDVSSWRSCREGDLPPPRLGRVRACLEVAHRSPLWRMPARHYLADEGPARFVVLDTNLLVADYGGFTLEEEAAFLAEATRGCDARPCFVVGHHPPASSGDHVDALGPQSPFVGRTRILEAAMRGPIAAWLGGHDHDLQHLRAPSGYDVLVSGNGSRWRDEKFGRSAPEGARALFASTAWGHLVLEVSATRWAARFESAGGEPLHCCRAAFPGPCRPVACAGGKVAAQ